MKTRNRPSAYGPMKLLTVTALTSFVAPLAMAQVALDSKTYTQTFDTLARSATGDRDSLPLGWDFVEAGTGKNFFYAADNGSSAASDTYSYGRLNNTDRAFGTLGPSSSSSTAFNSIIGVRFVNQTGSAIGSLSVGYTGEQWRLGAAGRADRLEFEYSTNANALDSSTAVWTPVAGLHFSSPITAGDPESNLNGDAAANRRALSAVVDGLNIAPGAGFFFRWRDINVSGLDDGLAVDDFSVRAESVAAPEPSTAVLFLAASTTLLLGRRRASA